MAEEFQAGICSGNWWNTARNEASPCTTAISDIGSFGWSNEMAGGDMKCVTRSSDESVSSNSLMMGFGLSLPTFGWNQSIFGRNNGITEQNFNTMLEQDLQQRSSFHQESGMESVPIQKEWSPKNYSDGSEDSFSQINQVALALDGHQNGLNSSKTSFPIVSSPALLPNLFESDPQPQPQQHPYETTPMSYQMINSNELSPWEKFPQFIKSASPKQQPNYSNLYFTDNTPFWSAAAGVMNHVGSTFSLSPQTQFPASSFGENPKCTSLAMKINHQLNTEEVRESGLKRSSTQEPTFKRPRVETPSPLPTFKVRKEKLGDRITALQQLVSPFGKTDTASVLYEAIEYIKFLHEQIHVLSTPYMKNGAPIIQHQQYSDKAKDNEGLKQDLRSRGLCLMPISSTFQVVETTADFWTPTFGGTYR